MNVAMVRRATPALLAALLWSVCAAHGQRLVQPPVRANAQFALPAPHLPGTRPLPGSEVHLKNPRAIGLTHHLTDGAGHRWDVNYYGGVSSGTGHPYGSGLYCLVDGNNVHSNGMGWLNQAGDEIEIGPYSRSGLNCYRRVKVYKDQPLARWLDILENRGAQAVQVHVRVYSSVNWGVQRQAFSTGGGRFTERDWGFVTQSAGPAELAVLAHIVCGRGSEVRPAVQITGTTILVDYRLVVAPRETAILCYFESQRGSFDAARKLVRRFRPLPLLRDLPASVRRRIANFPCVFSVGGIELERSTRVDTVLDRIGDPLYGVIANETFPLQTRFGRLDLPASQVIGAVTDPADERSVLMLLKDGQVIPGRVADDQQSLTLDSAVAGRLRVPIARVRQWSFRISEQRPDVFSPAGPVLVLRTGGTLAFDPASLHLELRTRYGDVPLRGGDLRAVHLDNPRHVVHRVLFRNGSTLPGFLEPRRFTVALRLGRPLEVDRNEVSLLRLVPEPRQDPGLSRLVLADGGELFGRLADAELPLSTAFGAVSVHPRHVKRIAFVARPPGRAKVVLWNDSTVRGVLEAESITFSVTPGPTLRLSPAQCLRIERPLALPGEKDMRRVERLVAELRSDDYKRRERATAALAGMGEGIVPLIRRRLADETDPEIRHRLEDVLERIPGSAPPASETVPAPPRAIRLGGWQ